MAILTAKINAQTFHYNKLNLKLAILNNYYL